MKMKKEKLLRCNNKTILFVMLFFVFVFFRYSPAVAQAQETARIFQIQVKADNFVVDRVLQTYVIDESNKLIKYNPGGIQTAAYSNSRLGRIGSFDVENPFNILVFYPDFYTIVILDNNLAEKSVINLIDYELESITAACLATDNSIWVFDEVDSKLKKISQTGKVLTESESLGRLLSYSPAPVLIKEVEQKVYLLDANGILVFDEFGHYLKMIPEKNIDYLQFLSDKIVYSKNKEIFVRSLTGMDDKAISLQFPSNFFKKMVIRKDRMYVLNDEGIDVFLKKK